MLKGNWDRQVAILIVFAKHDSSLFGEFVVAISDISRIMKKLRELIRSKSLPSRPKEEHYIYEDDRNDEDVVNSNSFRQSDDLIPSRASKVHSMLVDMREKSCNILTEEERTASKSLIFDPHNYEKTLQAAKEYALKERNRNIESNVSGESKMKENKMVKKKSKSKLSKKQLRQMLDETDKENQKPESIVAIEQMKNSNYFLKLSTQGDRTGGVDKSIPPSYVIQPHRVEKKDWTTPCQPYIPAAPNPIPPPPEDFTKVQKSPPKVPLNQSYWTGNNNEDETTLIMLLNKKYKNDSKKQKRVRFDLPNKKHVRFDIPEDGKHSKKKTSHYTKCTQKIHRGLLPRYLRNNTPINSVQELNYFEQVWTLLDDFFSKETICWMNDTIYRNIRMEGNSNMQSRQRVRLLRKGFEHAEALLNIPGSNKSLKLNSSKLTNVGYQQIKEKLLSQALCTSPFPPAAVSRFTEEFSHHWTFLCCFLVDAIIRKSILRNEYSTYDEKGVTWEDLKPQYSRVCMWESKFEMVLGEVLGGENIASRLLTLREYSLLRQFFDDTPDDSSD